MAHSLPFSISSSSLVVPYGLYIEQPGYIAIKFTENNHALQLQLFGIKAASEMAYTVSSGALNSTHSTRLDGIKEGSNKTDK